MSGYAKDRFGYKLVSRHNRGQIIGRQSVDLQKFKH